MLNISSVIKESIVDGPGIRYVVFTQGCPHRCKGCHNPTTHDLEGGTQVNPLDIVNDIAKNPLLSGVTFSGGEPILQAAQLLPLARGVVKLGKNCILYSGYTYEELIAMNDPAVNELLGLCKYLIDGRYVEELRDLTLTFRGSSNQRIIDLVTSLKLGNPITVKL